MGINDRAYVDMIDKVITKDLIRLKLAELIEKINDNSFFLNNPVHAIITKSTKNNPIPQDAIDGTINSITSAAEFNLAMKKLAQAFLYIRDVRYYYYNILNNRGNWQTTSSTSASYNKVNNLSNSIQRDVSIPVGTSGLRISSVGSLTPIEIESDSKMTNENVTKVLDDLYVAWSKLPPIVLDNRNYYCHNSCHSSCHGSGSGR